MRELDIPNPPWETQGLTCAVGDMWQGHYCAHGGTPGSWMFPDSMALLEGESAAIIYDDECVYE